MTQTTTAPTPRNKTNVLVTTIKTSKQMCWQKINNNKIRKQNKSVDNNYGKTTTTNKKCVDKKKQKSKKTETTKSRNTTN
jgi:hypothetical protein